jgi:hypothetical protein
MSAKDQRKRLRTVGKAGVGDCPDRSSGDGHVDDDANDHRADDPNGEVAARILRFLGCGRDGVEAVEGEEDDRSRRHHADLAS